MGVLPNNDEQIWENSSNTPPGHWASSYTPYVGVPYGFPRYWGARNKKFSIFQILDAVLRPL